jgi:hypothetical protein
VAKLQPPAPSAPRPGKSNRTKGACSTVAAKHKGFAVEVLHLHTQGTRALGVGGWRGG